MMDPRFDHVVRFIGRFRIRKTYLIAAAAVLGAYLLFGWLALPAILQSQAEKYIAERSGHRLTMDKPAFNPFTLSLRLKNLHLAEPSGKPLLAFKELLVDFSATSLFRRAYVFDEIRLDDLDTSLEVRPRDRLNWSALIEALRSKEKTSSELPRLIIKKFSLLRGKIDLADRRTSPGRATRLVPINIELSDLSTLPNESGTYALTARTNFGANIHWDGRVALKPISIAGTFRIDTLAFPKLTAFMALPAKIAAPEGTAALSTHYEAGIVGQAFNIRLNGLAARINSFRIQGRDDQNAALAFDSITLKGGQFDLHRRQIAIKSIALAGGGLRALRHADGKINLLSLFPAPAKHAPASSPGGSGWHYRIEHLTLAGFGVDVEDKTVSPAAEFALQDVSADVGGLNEDLKMPLTVHAAFRARDGGEFTADGSIVPADPSADLQIKLDGLALKPVQPYVGQSTTLKLIDGALSSEGHATYDAKGGAYEGSFAVRNLRIVEADGKQVFLAWKALTARTVTASPTNLAIREILLDGLDTRLIIAKDKSSNLSKILRSRGQAKPADRPSAAEYLVNVGRIRVSGGQLEFADHSLALPFGTHIHALSGTIVNISSRPGGAPARLKIDGQIDDYGMAQAEGLLDLFKPTDKLDIKVAFRNVEMTRLTPYSATFAGRRINSGKLTLNLEYKIDQRLLTGNNQIIMDQLTLGERVESPQAHDLPLDLAIAILEDSDGRIDLGLPVSGSLDDPKFSYGQIIWKAIVNVLTKIVTSPFRALGAIFGEDEQFDGIVFEAGQSGLAPPEREKLLRLSAALDKRPNLAVTLHGNWSEADRIAVQDLQLRKALAAKIGLSSEGDPGLITTDQPKVKPALEDLYASRFSNGELAAMKDGFRQANPGKLEETTSGKMMAMLTGVLGSKRALSGSDVAQMKGGDFHAILYQRLRAAENVPDEKLQALANARGETVMAELRKANAPLARLTLNATGKVEAAGKDIPFGMEMKPLAAVPANAAGR